jgi:lysophospholipase L1-like esterase
MRIAVGRTSYEERLQNEHKKAPAAVLNEGIIGNRVLRTEWGQNALARFDRDVLAQNGARYLIIFEGVNDVNWSASDEEASAEDLIGGISQLVARARAQGITVIAATLTPCADSDGFTEKREQIRLAINRWYQTAGVVDGVIDFDKAVRDPAKPSVLNPAYDSGDHLHPNDAGYAAMAKSIDLRLFR